MSKNQEITITKYKVERCGYYKPYAQKHPHLFGNISDTLKHLTAWSSGKNLSETKTYEKSDEELPTYLFDIHTHNNEYLICTWNESYATNGQVLSVAATEPVGTKKVIGADLPPGNIAGYPTYFWFRPLKNEFLTIQLPGTMNGRLNLNSYFEGFIKKFDPNHVVVTKHLGAETEAHHEIHGYTEKKGSKTFTLEEASGMFTSSLVRKKGGTKSELESLLGKIYKIIRKESITTTVNVTGSIVNGMLNRMGVKKFVGHSTSYDYKVKYEVDFVPTKDELNQIITYWKPKEKDTWDDIGFKIRGKSSVIWLSNEIDREKIEISVEQTEEGLIEIRSLLRELQKTKLD